MIDAYNYSYDANGNITQKLDGRGTTVYTYDTMNRLLKVTEPSGNVTTYTYDTAGNRKTESVKVGTVTTVPTYTYNANGNQLTETTGEVVTTNTYNVWNNLNWCVILYNLSKNQSILHDKNNRL